MSGPRDLDDLGVGDDTLDLASDADLRAEERAEQLTELAPDKRARISRRGPRRTPGAGVRG